jgi:hypothetical protein
MADAERKPKPGAGTRADMDPLTLRIFALEERVGDNHAAILASLADLRGDIGAVREEVTRVLAAETERRTVADKRAQDRWDRIVEFAGLHLGATCSALTTTKGMAAILALTTATLFLAFGYGDEVIRFGSAVASKWGLVDRPSASAPPSEPTP